ncbi:hypothetical protein AA0616_0205 [Komagataeibacter nataicola NRIC 0616]|nr:hypothetical protein AA0616_0205 [Komagataeibacter nataicola NRIC 0616]
MDEGFYLFVGGDMLHGAIPFVDVWDRKPLGLFIIYAFFHLFAPYQLWAYQLGALLSVCLTAIVVMKMARCVASATGALFAALLYVAWLDLAGGQGGQSPVFYNLLVGCAMLNIVRLIRAETLTQAEIIKRGSMAMLLFGLSLQIKYTTVFEGCFAGLFLGYILKRHRISWPDTGRDLTLFATIALLPTVVVGGTYWLCGYGSQWWFANIISIFYRTKEPPAILAHNFRNIALLIGPLLLNIVLQMFLCRNRTAVQRKCAFFFNAWSVCAVIGVFLIGEWFNHYAIPAFLPLSIASATLFTSSVGRVWLMVLLAAGTVAGQVMVLENQKRYGNARTFHNIMDVISKEKGCLFIYNGSAIFYDFLPPCRLTDHPFPGHFHSVVENRATGMDPATEIRKVLRQNPTYIMAYAPPAADENEAVRAILYDRIRQAYTEAYRERQGKGFLVLYRLDAPAGREQP